MGPRFLIPLAVAMLASFQAGASPRTSSLSWVRMQGAESCVATQALARAVEQRLHRSVFVSASQGEVSVEGHIERAASRWRAVITIRDGTGSLLGTRELQSRQPACSSLDESLALVIAVMIDPDAALSPTPEPEPVPVVPERVPVEPPPVTALPDVRPPVTAPPAVVAAPASGHWKGDVGASMSGAVGLLPGARWGLTVGGVLEPPGFVALRASASFWSTASVDVEQGARAEERLVSAALGACPLAGGTGRLRAHGCAGVQAGWLRARGVGFDEDRERSSLLASLVAEVRVRIGLFGPVSAQAGAAVLVPATRAALVYARPDGSTREAYRAPAAAVAGDVGLGVSLP